MIASSASAWSATSTLEVLLPLVGSATPEGTSTLAMLLSTFADGATATSVAMVKVATPAPEQSDGSPPSRSTDAFRLPSPLAGHVPLVATQLQLTFSRSAGKLSWTTAPVTSLGPQLVTTIS